MSMIAIPKLPVEFIEFGGCVTFETDKPELVSWVASNGLDSVVAKFSDGGHPCWLEVSIESWDEKKKIHLHVETSRVKPKHASDNDLRDAKDLVAIVSEFVEKIVSESPVIVSRARLSVPRVEIPEHGIIGRLLRFDQRSCGASFSVNGASLDIDDEVFTAMNFRENGDAVFVELWAESGIQFDSDFLIRLVELMQIGTDCYVFERSSREVTNA
jgi:hypothetical protein